MKTFEELRSVAIKSDNSEKKRIAVAAAADFEVLETVKMVNNSGLGSAILVGEAKKIEEFARQTGCDLNLNEVIEAKDDAEAARIAVTMAREGQADIVLKGMLQTATYLKAILNADYGIKNGKLLHLLSLLSFPGMERFIIAADCGMVIAPTLNDKIEMIKNCATVAGKIGIGCPKVACLNAVETVTPQMPDTVDAAVLAKMAERGQIKNVIVDGPLSFDLACYEEAARHKGIKSEVAGKADILIMPGIQAGNIFYKMATHTALAQTGTIIAGTAKPAVMTSRSDSAESKLNSIAIACLMSQ